jgi:hypothetical protein
MNLRKISFGPILGLIGLFVLVSLACAQAGQIVSPEEATVIAQQDRGDIRQAGEGPVLEAAGLQIGDTAILIGRGFLINLYSEPGGRISAGQERGAEVAILDIAFLDERLWYLIDAPTGEGWVPGDSLEAIVDESGGGEEGGFAIGDEAYLTGTAFLIELRREPGGFMRAGQERGTKVTILDSTKHTDGFTWYLIDAPTGEGWVSEENLTAEPPE